MHFTSYSLIIKLKRTLKCCTYFHKTLSYWMAFEFLVKISDTKYLYIYFSFLKIIKLSSYVQRYSHNVLWFHYNIYLTDSGFSLPVAITGFRCSESTPYFQWLTVAADFLQGIFRFSDFLLAGLQQINAQNSTNQFFFIFPWLHSCPLFLLRTSH